MTKSRVRWTFLNDDSGSGTAWWVLWMLVFLVLGGSAVDAANAWRMRAELQFTADAAAHAGVIDLPNQTAAAAAAEALAATNMNSGDHGDVLAAADIEFGSWDDANEEFVLPSGGGGGGGFGNTGGGGSVAVDAIRVTTRRDASNANQLATYFLRLIGMDAWDVNARAVAQRYWPACANNDGLIARRIVDMQSNNDLKTGICIHGNDHVEVNNGNTWEAGVTVTMPDLDDFVIPSSDMDTHNPGLPNALGEEWFDPKIVDHTDEIMNGFLDLSSPWMPSYIGTDSNGNTIKDNKIVKSVTSQQFDVGDAAPGYIYHVSCPGNSLLNLGNNVYLEKVIIIAECRIATGNNSVYEDVILASFAGDKPNESQYSKAINIGQGNRMGVDDNCALTGNVKLISNGSIDSAADVQFYGVQAIAVWDIKLAAQAEGLEGILLQAGNNIDIASNNSFGSTCADIGAIEVPYFRLVL